MFIFREEIEKQKSHERYMKLQEQGKTEQAKKDLGEIFFSMLCLPLSYFWRLLPWLYMYYSHGLLQDRTHIETDTTIRRVTFCE